MLKIKLARQGKKKSSHFKIVVAEKRSKSGGRFVAALGYYSPHTQPATVKVDRKQLNYWLSQGAQPTPTLNRLLKNQ